MFLEIENKDNLKLDGFCEFLIPIIREYAENENNWDPDQIKKWEDEFKVSSLNWALDDSGTPIVPPVRFIINEYFDHLQYTKIESSYLITSDKNLLLNYTDITIDSLASRINYGILDSKGYSYFEDVFQHFADRLQEFFNLYLTTTDEDVRPEKQNNSREEDS